MATDFWKDYEPEPHKGLSEHLAQATNGRVRIDPVTGDVGIGTAPVQEPVATLFGSLPVYDTTPPAAQQEHEPENEPFVSLASVQEPVLKPLSKKWRWVLHESFADVAGFDEEGIPSFYWQESATKFKSGELSVPCKGKNCGSMNGWLHSVECRAEHEAQYTTPPAHPAVPDAIIEAGESPEFRDGWNECRETMLQMLKARNT
jgi:hypothetical protein